LATQLVAADLKAAAVSEPHVLVPDAAPVGLMRLAHQATRACRFWAFALVMHGDCPVLVKRSTESAANRLRLFLDDVNESTRRTGGFARA
jgi:hypothetical protein